MDDVLKKSIAGALGGFVEASCFSRDVLGKTTLRYGIRFGNNAWLALCLADDNSHVTKPRLLVAGFLTGAMESILFQNREGLTSLKIGVNGTQQASMFFCKTLLDETFFPDPSEKSAWQSMAVGTAAAVPGLFLVASCKIFEQDQHNPLRCIWIRGFHKEMGGTLMRQALGIGIVWSVVDTVVKSLPR